MTELKPCPFCGAGREDLLILDRQDYGRYWKTGIYCYGCRSTILYDSDTDDEDRMLKDAVAKWNRRVEQRYLPNADGAEWMPASSISD